MSALATFAEQQSSVVLMGGQSTRMGSPKHQLVFAGQTLLQRLVSNLAALSAHVYVAGNCHASDLPNPQHSTTVIADQLANQLAYFEGPLAGIATALAHCQTPWLWVQSCDTLLLPSQLQPLITIDAHTPAGIVCFGQQNLPNYPLMGWYHVQLLPALQTYLASGGRRVMQFVSSQQLSVVNMPANLQPLCNFNTPTEFALACALAGQQHRAPT